MTIHHAMTNMDLPPPGTHTLYDMDRVVGWTTPTTIAFTGFQDVDEAAGAAWVTHRTMARRLAREGRARTIPVDVEPLTLIRRGDRELIIAGDQTIAILHRPDGHAATDWFAFEIEVSPPANDVRVQALAYLAYRTLRKSGIRWGMWQKPSPSPTTTARNVAAEKLDDVQLAKTPQWRSPKRSLRRRKRRRHVVHSQRAGSGGRGLWSPWSDRRSISLVAVLLFAVMSIALVIGAASRPIGVSSVLGVAVVVATALIALFGRHWITTTLGLRGRATAPHASQRAPRIVADESMPEALPRHFGGAS